MARGKDYYATLGVSREAKPTAIRNAYRHLARKLHPDVNPGDRAAEDRFKEVQEAYGVLKDKKKRAFYDRHGYYTDQAFRSGGRPQSHGPAGGFGFDGFDFSDFGGRGGSPGRIDFETLFNQFRGRPPGQGPEQTEASSGEDLEYGLDIGFLEAIRGTTVRVSVRRQQRCGPCKSSGFQEGGSSRQCTSCRGLGKVRMPAGNMRFTVPCSHCGGEGRTRIVCRQCGGEGRVPSRDRIRARIPAGTGENTRVRLQNQGNAGVRGGRPGDLYLVAHIREHPIFRRSGLDIRIRVPITPAEAILGAKIQVPTIDGTATMRVPPATSSGTTFRVRGRGVSDPRGGKRGDQFVRISIAVPKIPDENTKELMRQYAERNPENPRASILNAS